MPTTVIALAGTGIAASAVGAGIAAGGRGIDRSGTRTAGGAHGAVGNDAAVAQDNRTKSRWTQALKYAYGWRQPANRLKWFFKVNGGIAGCARKYADLQARRQAKQMMPAVPSGEPGNHCV